MIRCLGVSVIENSEVVMFLSCCLLISMCIANVTCKQVNKRVGFLLSLFLSTVKLCKDVNNAVYCIYM